MLATRALIGVLTAALAACGGASVDRPEHTAPETTGGTGMQLTSTAFSEGNRIPSKYTCDGAGVSPPLGIADIPAAAKTLVLVVDDPDAPRGTWDHWVAYGIAVTDRIPEGVAALGTSGVNSGGSKGYQGPCPPSGSHRYFFTVYALDAPLGLAPGATKAKVLDAIKGHVLAEATLMGLYSR